MSQAPHPNLQQAYDSYSQPKPAGDIDLIAEVRRTIMEAGLGLNIVAAYDNHRHIVEAQGKTSDIQRFLLNRYFNLQLSDCPNSRDARYSLIPNGTVSDWLRLFQTMVIPFMISNQLPRVINGLH